MRLVRRRAGTERSAAPRGRLPSPRRGPPTYPAPRRPRPAPRRAAASCQTCWQRRAPGVRRGAVTAPAREAGAQRRRPGGAAAGRGCAAFGRRAPSQWRPPPASLAPPQSPPALRYCHHCSAHRGFKAGGKEGRDGGSASARPLSPLGRPTGGSASMAVRSRPIARRPGPAPSTGEPLAAEPAPRPSPAAPRCLRDCGVAARPAGARFPRPASLLELRRGRRRRRECLGRCPSCACALPPPACPALA